MTADRRILLLTHTGRQEARDVARAVAPSLLARGIVVRMLDEEAKELDLPGGHGVELVDRDGRRGRRVRAGRGHRR